MNESTVTPTPSVTATPTPSVTATPTPSVTAPVFFHISFDLVEI
jgi:hypothetical protein